MEPSDVAHQSSPHHGPSLNES
ncbi:hypothetical protein CCACVL1_08761 [Corchorus capsularis]|uniref:Uncharacterized protein n=1 Tax=Corchorus capsularis TaxID=210143 RepID=A0A1R3IYZ4_COCAP|nr:hypothetical protein CCACVL1_08761 [Corchorus capsularis]